MGSVYHLMGSVYHHLMGFVYLMGFHKLMHTEFSYLSVCFSCSLSLECIWNHVLVNKFIIIELLIIINLNGIQKSFLSHQLELLHYDGCSFSRFCIWTCVVMFARFCFPVSFNYIIFLLFMIINLNNNLFNSKIHGIHSVI